MSVAVQNHYSTSASFLSSVSQYIHLLREQDRQVQGAALERLSQVVDQNWAEIAEHLSLIEELLDDNDFPKRELASYVASKIYYHLEVYEDALNYALKSGHYFNLDERSQYVQCLVTTCIKHYVESK
jgi:26S proteasome regulatory subunit N2